MEDVVSLPAIPAALRWAVAPRAWRVESGDVLVIAAGPRTDLFADPRGALPVHSSSRLLFVPPGDFVLSARVSVDFAATFDAGVLLVYVDEQAWAKLCLELSPRREPTIVSVVTRGVSDDCNSAVVTGGSAYLRVARLGRAFAFHYSEDSGYWHLVRHFALESGDQAAVGFSAQSPTGEGCTVRFAEISFGERCLGDIRGGE